MLPLYPQYAAATSGSSFDALAAWSKKQRWIPELRWVSSYHDDAGYIEALARGLEAGWAKDGRPEKLVLSFHGTPERSLHLGDPYHCHCHKTARLLRERLGLSGADCLVSFQSRFGAAKWLGPYTEPTLVRLAQSGTRRVQVACPGFSADCLETLEEIAMEAKHAFLEAGGERFDYAPCLNDDQAGIEALARIAERNLSGWPWRESPQGAEFALREQRAEALDRERQEDEKRESAKK
jgi:ferrochelatase